VQSGCRFNNIWRVLAVAGTVGAASVALAAGPEKPGDQKPAATSTSNVIAGAVAAPAKAQPKVEFEKYIVKAPEDNSVRPVLRGPGPVNGTCLTATPVPVPGSAFGDTTGGVPDPEGAVPCTVSSGAASAGMWFTFTGNGNILEVTTCDGATFDTVLRVFSGACGALTCVDGNDDGGCGVQSRVSFLSQAGVTYYAYVSAYGSAVSGPVTLTVIDLGSPQGNDFCEGAETLVCNSSIIADNSQASISPTDSWTCHWGGGVGAGSIWYKFVATADSARIQTCASAAPADDSALEVFVGDCANGLISIGCSEDDCNGFLSRLDLTGLTIGQEYYVQLSSWSVADRGPYVLELICPLPPVTPGDTCATALPLGPLPAMVSGDTTLFEPDPGLPACGVGAGAPSVWYSMVGNGSIIGVDICDANYDGAVAVFTGDCFNLTCVTNDDDGCGTLGGPARTSFLSNPGQTYYIVVRGYATSAGSYTMLVTDLGSPAEGDACVTALPLSVPGTAFGDTCMATPDGALGCGTGDSSPGVWYQVTGTGNQFIATLCNGTSYDSALSVFTGGCDFLSCVASNDDSCGAQSQVIFQTFPGETYYILVRGYSTNCGFYTLDVTELLPPANDECVNATEVFCNSFALADNLGATDNFIDDIYLCRVVPGNGSNSVWFKFTAAEDSAVIATCNSSFPADDSILQVFEGSCGFLSPLPDGCNDDGCNGYLSRVIVRNLVVGNTYYIMLSAWTPADAGTYTLELTCPAPPPAPGDDCVDAIDFGPIPGSVSGETMTANPDAVDTCGGPGAAANGVWFRVVAPLNATQLRASTCDAADFDTVIRVYNGPCEFLSCVGYNDDNCPTGLQSSFVWDVIGGQEYYVWVGGYGTASGSFTLTIDEPPPPCDITIPGNAMAEGEADCGIPFDTVNGGCNSAPPVFGAIECGVPFYGTVGYDGFTRDTDWLQFTLSETTEVTLTIESEVAVLFGFIEVITPNPTGSCDETTGYVAPYAFTQSDCMPYSVTATLGAGTWTVFVAPDFNAPPISCGSAHSEYVLLLTGCGGEQPDCNNNGIPDGNEIAGGANDCFNPLVMSAPYTMGGADGFLDECQCAANWDRDGSVNSNDISAFLTSWLNAVGGGPVSADFDCDGATNSNDISAFLSSWLAAVQNTVPHDGCP